MKKIIVVVLLTIGLLLFPKNVLASGGITISTTSLSMEEGSSRTFTITAINTIGDVTIASSNSSVATVSSGSWTTGMVGSGENKSTTITVTGISEGTTSIVLTLDGSTFDEEPVTGNRTISVYVSKKQVQPDPTPTPTPTPTPQPTNNTNNNSNNTPKEETKSNNSKLKQLSIDNYELKKIDDNNYELIVENNVAMVSIKAVADDSKAKITGTGVHELKVGDNKIELVVTAEDGSTNKINVKVTRKDEEEVIKTSTDDTKNITSKPNKTGNSINIIEIFMILLNIILAVLVVVLFNKNKRLRESINKIS
ncbi:MAG: cadherin-like beta sandwich domain-containing protein [Bacilli bacterium]|nr:cadherin-like beta sandwich domain-containing protein [Bacilli bacterium]